MKRVHRCTLLATELLNLDVRDRLQHHEETGLHLVCDSNWLLNAYHEVTYGKKTTKVISELRATRDAHMPAFVAVDRAGLTQILGYECRNLAAVAATNIVLHFRRRLLSHVRRVCALSGAEFAALSKDERRARRLRLMQVADDLARPPSEAKRSPADDHAWVASERARLCIDAAVGNWDGKPLEYHLKIHPQRFLKTMHLMTAEREADGRSAFALFPLRRTLVPRHIRTNRRPFLVWSAMRIL